MTEEPALTVRRDQDDAAGREPGGGFVGFQGSIREEGRPLVIEIGRMLDPVPAAVHEGARCRPSDVRQRVRDIGGPHRELVRVGQVPVDAEPAPAQARHVAEVGPGISGGGPGDGVRGPVPDVVRAPRAVEGEADVTAGPVDARLVQAGIRVGLERARARFIADRGASVGPAQPGEQPVVLALVQPYRVDIRPGPAIARGLGHGPNVEAADRAAAAAAAAGDIGVVRGRRVVREREGQVDPRSEGAGELARIADAGTGREIDEEVGSAGPAVLVDEHGAGAAVVRQRDLVAAIGVVVPPVTAGDGVAARRELVDLHVGGRVGIRGARRHGSHAERVVG